MCHELLLGSFSDNSFSNKVGIFVDEFDRSLFRFVGTIILLKRFHNGILLDGDDCVTFEEFTVVVGRILNEVAVEGESEEYFSRDLV